VVFLWTANGPWHGQNAKKSRTAWVRFFHASGTDSGPASGYEVKHERDHREDDQEVNQQSCAFEHHEAADPKDEQDYCQNQEHADLP
jgi:hypothetical protein